MAITKVFGGLSVGGAPKKVVPSILRQVHEQYFLAHQVFYKLDMYVKSVTEHGLLDLRLDFPPVPQLLAQKGFALYPHFSLVDKGQAVTIPFKAAGKLWLMRIGVAEWGDLPVCDFKVMPGGFRVSYHEGTGFDAERFKRLSAQYATNGMESLAETTPEYLRWLVGQIKPQGDLLSIGCGNGVVEKALMDEYGVKVFGIESSPQRIASARSKGIEVATDLTTAFPGRKFAQTMILESMGYFWPDQFWAQLKPRLTHHAELFLVDPIKGSSLANMMVPHYHYYTWSQLQKVLSRRGFAVTEADFVATKVQEINGELKVLSFGVQKDPTQSQMAVVRAKR